MSTQYILGVNAYHGDSSACLVRDGTLLAAAEEERFRRLKHWAGLPTEAVRYCLMEAGIGFGDVAVLAVNTNPAAAWYPKVMHAVRYRPELGLIASRLRNMRKRRSIALELSKALEQPFHGRLALVEHHRAHLSSAFHVSPFEEAVAVSVDGFGDFASAAWGVGSHGEIRIEGRIHFPHSLGLFYQAMTQYLGFPHYGDEYKVMGLAPYGRPTFLDEMRKIVRLHVDGRYELDLRYFRHHRERFQYAWDGGLPTVGPLFTEALEDLLGPARAGGQPLEQRHKDLAHSVQAAYEHSFFHLLNAVHARYPHDCLALAGGCAMNSVANGKITRRSPFKRVYVQAAAGDAGGAIGAAFSAFYDTKPGSSRSRMDHAFWGPAFSDADIGAALHARSSDITEQACVVRHVEDEAALCAETARSVANGGVVGWFQGRLEWGPRALGNRSIVCDPRRADMKDILNLKIKRRESFRPFAPSIHREAVPDWFEIDDDVPFMMQVFPIRPEKRNQIPAVTHVDGSGRLQTVHEATNPRYYRLIDEFRKLTGIPIVLNTSFNENEPVVCRPEEALDCFLRTKMDLLVMGNWVVERAA